jgi:CheY-like chemotaxis protein
MRILLIEDNAGFAGEVERAIRAIPECDEIVWARSRDGALAALAAGSFDLVILDRRIPSADDVLDDHPDHGWTVFQAIRTQSSGTPVWFLTGTEDADFAVDINNAHGRTEDLHGLRVPEQMYQVFWKRRIADCVRRIGEFAARRAALERIAVQPRPATLALNADESRAIRICSRRHNGSLVDVTSLNGGLSNSRVLKVIVKAADMRVLVTAAAKVSSLAETTAEAEKYRTDISRLAPGGFPQLTERIDAGAGNTGGLFYGMVGDQVESLFDRIRAGHEGIAEVPSEIRAIMGTWYQGKRVEQIQISQIRRKLIGDTVLHRHRAELEGIDIAGIENRTIPTATCCQHGDLHCANVVFDGRGRAMLIDFGDTGPSYAAVDPVTLELSTIFHSQHATLPPGWPTEENILEWTQVERVIAGCQFGPFISACRQWANGEAGSPDEVIAVAYAYAMRQLKYPDTNKRLARALIRSCIEYFRVPRAR